MLDLVRMIDALDGRTPHVFGEEFSQADLRSALVELKGARVTIATMADDLNSDSDFEAEHRDCVPIGELSDAEEKARQAADERDEMQDVCVAGCFDDCRAGH